MQESKWPKGAVEQLPLVGESLPQREGDREAVALPGEDEAELPEAAKEAFQVVPVEGAAVEGN